MHPDLPDALALLGAGVYLLAIIPLLPIARVLGKLPGNTFTGGLRQGSLIGGALIVAGVGGGLAGAGLALGA